MKPLTTADLDALDETIASWLHDGREWAPHRIADVAALVADVRQSRRTLADVRAVVEELAGKASRATPGPWFASDDCEPVRVCHAAVSAYDNIVTGHDAAGRSPSLSVADAALICAAVNAIPRLASTLGAKP